MWSERDALSEKKKKKKEGEEVAVIDILKLWQDFNNWLWLLQHDHICFWVYDNYLTEYKNLLI